jgi:hypothetical protein
LYFPRASFNSSTVSSASSPERAASGDISGIELVYKGCRR